jgi:cytochrome c556
MINITKATVATIMLLVGLASVTSVIAHGGATGVVKQRMDAMSDMAGAMKKMAPVVKGKQAFNRVLFVESGELIAGHSNMLPDLFPDGSIEGSSEALPAIWQQWDDFMSLSDRTKTNAERLVNMAQDGAELGPLTKQFVKIAGDCKACHKKYRKKK